jgi:putative peptide zinc metalloprotease protein
LAVVAEQAAPPLSERLRAVCVGLREDLAVARHLFRGEPSYVVSDPLTFQNHKLSLQDYEILISIRPDRKLDDIFRSLVEQGRLGEDQRERFFEFVLNLHRLGFLNLPVSDDKLLYRRYVARKRMKRRQRVVGFLFLQIPLWNPARFLETRKRFADLLFSRVAFFAWMCLMLAAGSVLVGRWSAFCAPINGLLAVQNLPLMWIALVGLKALHEFGHAFACRHYGVHVPEMGVMLIAGTPCAYVDATGSWSLSRRYQRIVVGLGGMYFESFVAAAAVFVWAFTRPGLLNDLAYNAVLLAGVVTALFNINPLMRYDGYYIFSDLVEIPNLRARSTEYALAVLRRITLGLPIGRQPKGRTQRALLMGYGTAAPVYKATVMLAIVAMIASKLFYVGLLLGGYMIARGIYTAARRAVSFLWFSEQTSPVRRRAVAYSLLLIGAPPLAATVIPVRRTVETRAVIAADRRAVLHARAPGFLVDVNYEEGAPAHPGQPLMRLANDGVEQALAQAETNLEAARLRRDALQVDDPVRARQEAGRVRALEDVVAHHRERLASLVVDATQDGRVIAGLRPAEIGRFVESGEPLATLVSGPWMARALLSEDEVADARPQIGTPVLFRSAAFPASLLEGTIVRVNPEGVRTVDSEALTHAGGGPIAIAPDSGLTREPYFHIWVQLREDASVPLREGMTGRIQLATGADPIGLHFYRSFIRFVRSLQQE